MRERLRATWPEVVIALVFVGLVGGYSLWVAFGLGPDRITVGPDSTLYLAAARAPVWSRELLAGPGPFVFLLLVKAAARDLQAIVVVQTLGYVAAWIWLAAAARSALRARAAQLVTFGGLLALGTAPRLIVWNVTIATESVALAVSCALVASALGFVRRPRAGSAVLFCAALAVFGFTRDTNALALAVIVVVAGLAAALVRSQRSAAFATAGVAAAVAVGAMALSGQAEPPRWLHPVNENITFRVIGDPGAERFFTERGMPLDENLRTLPDEFFLRARELRDGPQFEALRAWTREHGRDTYVRWLLQDPLALVADPFGERHRVVLPDVVGYSIFPRNAPPAVYAAVGAAGLPPVTWLGELLLLASGVALVVLATARRAHGGVLAVVATTMVLAVAGFAAAYHGDALEIDRHSLTSAVQLRIGVWLTLGLVLDAVLTRSRVEVEGQPARDDGEEGGLRGQREVELGTRPG